MIESNADILKRELGEENYEDYIQDPIRDFHVVLKDEKDCSRAQKFLTIMTFAISSAIAEALIHQRIHPLPGFAVEMATLIGGAAFHQAIQNDRVNYAKKAEECISKIRSIVPEKLRLIIESVMAENNVSPADIPVLHSSEKKIRYIQHAVIRAIEQAVPYIASLFI